MKIKVGEKIYDGEKEPIMLILSDEDKKNIAKMASDATMFCQYPRNLYSEEWIDNWMGPSPTGRKLEEIK